MYESAPEYGKMHMSDIGVIFITVFEIAVVGGGGLLGSQISRVV